MNAMHEALVWALAELRDETTYDNDQQRQNCFDLADEAIAAWNRRAAPTDAGGAVSEAEAFLNEAVAFAYQHGLHEIGYDPVAKLKAALTPAPQAEGDAVAWRFLSVHDPKREWGFSERPVEVNEHYDVVQALGVLSAPQPLQQGGEVTREQVARVLCRQARLLQGFKVSDGYTLEDEVENSFDLFLTDADAILALFASRQKDQPHD